MPASSGFYEQIESITARLPAHGVFLSERAVSRAQAETFVRRIAAAIDSDSSVTPERRASLRAELDLIRSAIADSRDTYQGSRGVVAATWRADLLRTYARTQRMESNGLGTIDALTNPFTIGRQGWPIVEGSIATIGPTFLAATPTRFAVAVQPQGSLVSMRDGGWTAERFLHRAYARASFFNVAMSIGADEQRWGQSHFAPLFISGNAQPLPAVQVGTDTAIVLPWILRTLGPARFSMFVADLGETQQPPRARLAGWHGVMQPSPRIEFALSTLVHTGGRGGPPATFLERVVDFFPIIDALAPQHADLQFSNKLAGGSLRLRIPEISGLDLLYEMQIDDFDGRRLASTFRDDAAHVLGARLPTTIRGEEIVWRGEWHNTSIRLYEHTQFSSGVTYRGRIIGSHLGPNAAAGYFGVEWRRMMQTVSLNLADERRDPSQYVATTSGPRDRGFTFVKVSDEPRHRRLRAELSTSRSLGRGALWAKVGYNRAMRDGEATRSEWLGLLGFSSRMMAMF